MDISKNLKRTKEYVKTRNGIIGQLVEAIIHFPYPTAIEYIINDKGNNVHIFDNKDEIIMHSENILDLIKE